MQAFIRPSMGQRDFNVDERVHYIKNICCLNSLNWTIFSQFIAFWFYFFYKGKNYNSSSRFQAHGLPNALCIWKTRFRNNMNMIIINLVVNIWPSWGDLCFFLILKRDFFWGGGGHVQTRVDLPSGPCLRPALWFRNHLRSNICDDGWLWMLCYE